ncbi:hypothetical protein SAMN02745174_01855 [Cetobacterium ceti]|uniref:Uncharacterized protein n=1 Tax=Cetobacterium ceti TaxID=180163 RepID=A0A1T4PCP3_9FUSO|nr:hypothetical protein [Cetobacterium ceti]SJZ89323.1 hypothetical protein SAMN02745174_01855 [Cetobacterium ceti]
MNRENISWYILYLFSWIAYFIYPLIEVFLILLIFGLFMLFEEKKDITKSSLNGKQIDKLIIDNDFNKNINKLLAMRKIYNKLSFFAAIYLVSFIGIKTYLMEYKICPLILLNKISIFGVVLFILICLFLTKEIKIIQKLEILLNRANEIKNRKLYKLERFLLNYISLYSTQLFAGDEISPIRDIIMNHLILFIHSIFNFITI